jgi:hypothetical protein
VIVLLEKQSNTLRQGNIGLGIAISYFTMRGCYVSLPLNDIQDYDLITDYGDGILKKVQVKTTRFKERGKHYKVELMTTKKPFTQNSSDIVFIVDGDGVQYLIPRDEIKASKGIVLGKNYEKYIV